MNNQKIIEGLKDFIKAVENNKAQAIAAGNEKVIKICDKQIAALLADIEKFQK